MPVQRPIQALEIHARHLFHRTRTGAAAAAHHGRLHANRLRSPSGASCWRPILAKACLLWGAGLASSVGPVWTMESSGSSSTSSIRPQPRDQAWQTRPPRSSHVQNKKFSAVEAMRMIQGCCRLEIRESGPTCLFQADICLVLANHPPDTADSCEHTLALGKTNTRARVAPATGSTCFARYAEPEVTVTPCSARDGEPEFYSCSF